MLREWAATMGRALRDMAADVEAGRLVDDTLPRDMDFLRHLMGRREIIVGELLALQGRHRGPGTALHRELGGRQ